MFGKKKVVATQPKTCICTECGIDCIDQYNLDRHTDWAHPKGKKQESTTSEKKA